jgi:signal transduction histidine kinase/CheY-like chemotaxis protein
MRNEEPDCSQLEQEKRSSVQTTRILKTTPLLVGTLSVFAGGLILVGWAFDLTALKSIMPGWVSTKANAALGFILAGLALQISSLSATTLSVRLTRLCALLCGLIGLLTLGEYLFTWNPGFDQWLFYEPANMAGTSHPGRMTPTTAACFVLLATGLEFACAQRKTTKIFLTSSILGTLLMAVSLTAILSYATMILIPFGFWSLSLMAAPTATLFILLGVAIVLNAWPEGIALWSLAGRTVMGLAIWSLMVVGSLTWSLHQQGHHLLEAATVAARANSNKDIGFRKWAASHGGVYVPPTKHTPPNPHLNVPDRDVVTTSGKVLTLMNPAYMLREMQHDFSDEYGTRSRLTSLMPLNPNNAPDAWQVKALSKFERGDKELLEVEYLNGLPHLRLMLPFMVEPACLKCHAQQGYKSGDVRGGIDSSISLVPFLERAQENDTALILSHGAIWLLGISGMLLFYWREHSLAEENRRMEEEKRKLESQLRQAQKMEAIGTLAGGIAHDFNNILSIIFGYTELAMEEKNPEERQQHLLDLRNGAERAKELVGQILAFSRKAEQQMQPLQVSAIIKEALKMLRASIPATIEIRQDIASNGLVLADPTQIHQVIMNLCTNAYHAMRETGGILAVSLKEVTIGATEYGYANITQGNYLKLEVSDTGCGIDQKTQEKIFEPYFTTKKPGEGTGLGLAVVHGIVNSHHGHITVYSEPGEGTSFHVYLPLTEQDVSALPDKTEPKELRGKGERILFVDDEKQIRKVLGTMLTKNGYQVTASADGAQALEEFQKNPDQFDLVITDMTMPSMTGAELAQKIMAISPQTPVILCTGQSELINREKALAMGVRDYLNKPILQETLLGAARKALNNRNSAFDHSKGA